MANSVDSDETPRSAASLLGLHCLLRPVYPNTFDKYGIPQIVIGLFFLSFSLFCISNGSTFSKIKSENNKINKTTSLRKHIVHNTISRNAFLFSCLY